MADLVPQTANTALAEQAVSVSEKKFEKLFSITPAEHRELVGYLQNIQNPETLQRFTANVEAMKPPTTGKGLAAGLRKAAENAAYPSWHSIPDGSAKEPFTQAGQRLEAIYDAYQALTEKKRAEAEAARVAAAKLKKEQERQEKLAKQREKLEQENLAKEQHEQQEAAKLAQQQATLTTQQVSALTADPPATASNTTNNQPPSLADMQAYNASAFSITQQPASLQISTLMQARASSPKFQLSQQPGAVTMPVAPSSPAAVAPTPLAAPVAPAAQPSSPVIAASAAAQEPFSVAKASDSFLAIRSAPSQLPADMKRSEQFAQNQSIAANTPSIRPPAAPQPPVQQAATPQSETTSATQPTAQPAPVAPDLSPGYFNFGSGKSALNDADKKQIADWAKAYKDSGSNEMITIAGHADTTGHKKTNERISARRAQAVADCLKENGVDPSRIKTVAYGSDEAHLMVHHAGKHVSDELNRVAELTVGDQTGHAPAFSYNGSGQRPRNKPFLHSDDVAPKPKDMTPGHAPAAQIMATADTGKQRMRPQSLTV